MSGASFVFKASSVVSAIAAFAPCGLGATAARAQTPTKKSAPKPAPVPAKPAENPNLLLAKGAAYARLGDYSHALAAYSVVLKNKPQGTSLLLVRAQTLLSRSRAEAQIKAAGKTLAARPTDRTARLRRAFALCNTGNYQRAVADYDFLLDKNDEDVAAYLGRALAYVASEAWGDAAADYRRAFLLRPDLIPDAPAPDNFRLLMDWSGVKNTTTTPQAPKM